MLIEDAGLFTLFLLAFASGANDVGKSVATIVETSRGRSIRKALVWGGLFSALGSVTAVLIATQLLSTFTSVLLTPTPENRFILAALTGTALWIIGATLLRLPVSLTHAIIGSILIQATYLYGLAHLDWTNVIIRVFLPLAGVPIAAFLLTYLVHKVRRERPAQLAQPAQPAQLQPAKKPGRTISLIHWLITAATAYARGINDAPKMVALAIIILPLSLKTQNWTPYAIVGLGAFAGSVIWGHWVTQTLVGRLVHMTKDKHIAAGVATAVLVSVGAVLGAPLSSTHIHNGATAGISGGRREHLQTALASSLLAWFVTLPAAGLLSIGAYSLIGKIPGF